jgi:hypothetical protein
MAGLLVEGEHDGHTARFRGHHGTTVVELEDDGAPEYPPKHVNRRQDSDFLSLAEARRYQPSPLDRPFPPLSAKGRAELGPLASTLRPGSWGGSATDRPQLPQYGTLATGEWNPVSTGTFGSARPGSTASAARHCDTLAIYRVALPLDTAPRVSPRSTRVLRGSAYGRGCWDRTDTTHIAAAPADVRGAPTSSSHAAALRPWVTSSPRDWKRWQQSPAVRQQSVRARHTTQSEGGLSCLF